jgi:hypothetical protein
MDWSHTQPRSALGSDSDEPVGDTLSVASMFGFQGTKQRTLRTKMAVQRVVRFERGASTMRTSVHDGIERCRLV